MACIVCGSSKTTVLYPRTLPDNDLSRSSYQITESAVGKHEEIVQCSDCSLVFVSSLPFDDSYTYYEDQICDEAYIEEQKNRQRIARHVLKKITKAQDGITGRLIDLGCSTGTFLSAAKRQGWEVYGIELSTWAVQEAKRAYAIDVVQGSVFDELARFPDDYFNVIVAFDVIEHVERPDMFATLIYKKLAPGGLVVLGTPNIDSVMAKVTKDRWYAIVPSHLFYFSPKTITKLLEKYGFTGVRVKTHTRFFSLGYVGYRLEGFSFPLLKLCGKILKQKIFHHIVIPINLGQEMEVYAYKR